MYLQPPPVDPPYIQSSSALQVNEVRQHLKRTPSRSKQSIYTKLGFAVPRKLGKDYFENMPQEAEVDFSIRNTKNHLIRNTRIH